MAEVRKVRDLYVDVTNPPVNSAVEISRLINDEFMIEVEAIAVIEE